MLRSWEYIVVELETRFLGQFQWLEFPVVHQKQREPVWKRTFNPGRRGGCNFTWKSSKKYTFAKETECNQDGQYSLQGQRSGTKIYDQLSSKFILSSWRNNSTHYHTYVPEIIGNGQISYGLPCRSTKGSLSTSRNTVSIYVLRMRLD